MPSPTELAELADKYGEMLRLRVHGPEDPRPSLVRLAARFPGALREIDDLSLEALSTRHDEVTRAMRDPAERAPWMAAMVLFHRLARGALAAKRWLAGAKRIDPDLRVSFLAALEAGTLNPEAGAWSEGLDAVAAPPRGRLTSLVFSRIGDELGLSAKDAQLLVFGRSRRDRSGH